MGRHKTISDEEVLRVARDLFRAQGHTVTTRAIAEAAGISEAILYQRFGSKDDLFFAAMHPSGPDLEQLLGPEDPTEDAHTYLRTVIVRMAEYFADVIPLALHVMTHPAFDPASLARAVPRGSSILQDGLVKRLTSLARRRRIAPGSEALTARLLVSLAHDWGLGSAVSRSASPRPTRDLKEMVDVLWEGLQARPD
jgi:AcrR family transcriptional regulator